MSIQWQGTRHDWSGLQLFAEVNESLFNQFNNYLSPSIEGLTTGGILELPSNQNDMVMMCYESSMNNYLLMTDDNN